MVDELSDGAPEYTIEEEKLYNRLDPELQRVILFSPLMEKGTWQLRFSPLDDGTGLPFEIHAWTETDVQPSTFGNEQPTDHGCTLNTFGCGHSPIVVDAYRSLQPESRLEISGEGPTRDGKLKPEVSAPGVNITAAKALSGSTAKFTGTSMAAPHVTGLVALLMQAVGKPQPVERIRDVIINSTRNNPPSPDSGWDSCYGAGRADAVAALRALKSQAQSVAMIKVTHSEVVLAEVVATATRGDGGEIIEAAVSSVSAETRTVTVSTAKVSDSAQVEGEADTLAAGGSVASPPAATFTPPVTRGH
jgi:hypothetical protein